MAKIVNLEATIAGLKSENEHLLRLLVRSTPVRFYERLSECWMKLLISRMHESP